MNVLVLHFTHPEGYPPTLNAINCIAEKATKLIILSTDTLPTKWKYAQNVDLKLIKGEHDRFKFVNRSKLEKFKTYYTYVKKIRSILKKEAIDLVVIYDDVPFFLYLLATIFLKKNYKLWYHNHDVYPLNAFKKYGINWLGASTRNKYFNKNNYFSLPALERKVMFPLSNFKGQIYYIPNYPSKKIIQPLKKNFKNWDSEPCIKIVYPGSPSIKNGFEELIDVMPHPINNKKITLTIVGQTNTKYKQELLNYAISKGVKKQLFFVERLPYVEMSNFLKNYHIGWAMYKPLDMSVSTAGSSSNKIYEFLANGLPIIVLDNEHHKKHLSISKATFFCDLSPQSIIKSIENINENISDLSEKAINEFEDNYQFEIKFNNALTEIIKDIKEPKKLK
ncbi:MAG: glycosyltransferase [Vicingaceae bacterium]|nr:glycosyltransferase [Vicingaceae bacterium]